MTVRPALWRTGGALVLAATLLGVLYAQRPFRQYPTVEEHASAGLPRDWRRPADIAFQQSSTDLVAGST